MNGSPTMAMPAAAAGRRADITVINPLTDTAWDRFVDGCANANVFHTSRWLHVLADTYGFEPRGLIFKEEAGVIRAGLPVVSLPGGRHVSLPFSDYCPPLGNDSEAAAALLRFIASIAGVHPGDTFELRGGGIGDPISHGFIEGPGFFRHTVDLHGELESIEGRFESATRRAVRKAEREGLTVRIAAGEADVRAFFELVVRTRRKQRLLPQPLRFFEQIRRHFFDGEHGCLLLAQDRGRVIAGDLLLRHGDTLVYKFNASDERYLAARPNNLLLAHAIRLGHRLGCSMLDLGRCDLDGDGLRRFKLLWGSDEEVFHHYYYPHRPGPPHGLTSRLRSTLLPLAVQHSPGAALRYAGDLLYKGFA